MSNTITVPERAALIQEFGQLAPVRLGLADVVRHNGVANDLIVSQIIRGNETQSWFIYRHLSSQEQSR